MNVLLHAKGRTLYVAILREAVPKKYSKHKVC